MRSRIQFHRIELALLLAPLCGCAAFAPPAGWQDHPERKNTVEKIGEAVRDAGAVADGSTPWGAALALAGTALTALGGWYRIKRGEQEGKDDHGANEAAIDAIRGKANALEARLTNLEIDSNLRAAKNPPLPAGFTLTGPGAKV